MTLIVQMLPFSLTLSHSNQFGFPAVCFCVLNSIADPEESYQSSYDFTVSSLSEDDSSVFETASKFFHQVHSLIHSIQIQRSWKSTKNDSSRVTLTSFPALLPYRHIHLPFHPKETVHIQTNRGDGYCPNAIILYCPSRWLPWDKESTVDAASSVWIGG